VKGKSMRAAGFAPQRDKNEPDIVNALEAVGASVSRISSLGIPDLLVGWRGDTFLLEVKNGKAKLNDNQVAWHNAWNGAPAIIVRTPEEALGAIGVTIVSPGLWLDVGVPRTYPRGDCQSAGLQTRSKARS
jgi:hypothetical protein